MRDETFGESVVFWMNDGSIERIFALVNPQKPDRLTGFILAERFLQELRERFTVGDRSLWSFFDKSFGSGIVHARNAFENFDIGMIHIDASFGDRCRDGFLESRLKFTLGQLALIGS